MTEDVKKEDWQIEYERDLGATYSTQGFRKLWNYFLDIVKSNYFQNKIINIRKRYKIPEKGFNTEKTYYAVKDGLMEKDYKKNAIKINEYDIWQGEDIKRTEMAEKVIANETDKICKKYGLHYLDWGEVIEQYVYFNKLPKDNPQFPHSNSYNLCAITDLAELAEEPFGKQLTRADNDIFPIAIRLSPYATERDIIDYVKKMSPQIKKYQKQYIKPDIKIGKIKKKKPAIQERNDFIYNNKKLSLNETKELVEKKFGESLDYEYIGKIRSEETKRRKEV